MSLTTIGDMARHYVLQRQNAFLKQEIDDLVKVLASGEIRDKADPVTGEYSLLGNIERSLRLLDGYDLAGREARVFADAAQAALGAVQDRTEDLSGDLILAAQSGTSTGLAVVSRNALQVFSDIIDRLNTTVSGRSVFAGVGTSGPALVDGDTMLSELRTAVAGMTSPSDITAVVTAWFDAPGGGFETLGYLGEESPLAPFRLGEADQVQMAVMADDPALRTILKQAALAALAADDSVDLTAESQRILLQQAGQQIVGDVKGLTDLRAGIGALQEAISASETENAAARSGYELLKSEMIAADPYETATQLEETRVQLETLYAVTARLSGMTLARYLG